MAYSETDNTTAIDNVTYVYKAARPTCDPEDVVMNLSAGSVTWTQTLTSLTGILKCESGYTLNGTANIACDSTGKI